MKDDVIMNAMPSPDSNVPYKKGEKIAAGQDVINQPVEFDSSEKEALEKKHHLLDAEVNFQPKMAQDQLEDQATSDQNNSVIIVDGETRIVNAIPYPNLFELPTFESAIRAGEIPLEEMQVAAPERFDLREDFWTIWDQGQTGSCVGQALAGILTYMFTKTKALKVGERLSARAIWMNSKELDTYTQFPTCSIETEGTYLKSALDIVMRIGVIPEALMPFDSLYRKDLNSYLRASAPFRILSYYNLGKNIEQWKKWLSTKGPIFAAINVDDTFQYASRKQGNLNNYNMYALMGGHAIALVGYTKDRVIIRNSWGTAWGDGGYAYATYDWCAKAILETYGISIL